MFVTVVPLSSPNEAVEIVWKKGSFGFDLSVTYTLCITWLVSQGKLTYGKIGEWRFDKRSFTDGPPPRNLAMPPPGVPESVVSMNNCHAMSYICIIYVLLPLSAWVSTNRASIG